jgi:hypothetical protein
MEICPAYRPARAMAEHEVFYCRESALCNGTPRKKFFHVIPQNFIEIGDERLLLSALYCSLHMAAGAGCEPGPHDSVAVGSEAGLVLRFVNFSPATVSSKVAIRLHIF